MTDQSSKIDSYLTHALNALRNRPPDATLESLGGLKPKGTRSESAPVGEIELPVLLRVVSEHFQPDNIPGFTLKSDLGDLVAGLATPAALQALQNDPNVVSVEAGRDGFLEKVESTEFVGATQVNRPPISEQGSDVIIGIVDTGIDVLHEAFLDAAGNSRILAIWDQGDPTGPTPKNKGIARDLNFGTLHDNAVIDQYVSSQNVPPALGRDAGVNLGHGTLVASVAAGRKTTNTPEGMAPDAKIIVIKPQLKTKDDDVSSIGYSLGHAAALRFADAFAAREGMPIVVNTSLGMNAGAHDGSSLLEAVFDEFTKGGRQAGRCVVKSAGNERHLNVHAELSMMTGVTESLEWESAQPHYSPDAVELWYPSENLYKFRLKHPNGETTDWAYLSATDITGQFSDGVIYAIAINRFFKDNGDTRCLVTLASGPFNPIPPGTFVLEVEGEHVQSTGRIDAWIERDNFRAVSFSSHISEDMTLTIPGTARTVVTVGSIGHANGVRPSIFSSRGLSRDGRKKPDVCAPGENITGADSGTSDGSRTDTGTSFAAPHVTGAIALAMSRCNHNGKRVPNAMQIAAALRGTAKNYRGEHTTTFGYGVLDAEAFFREITESN